MKVSLLVIGDEILDGLREDKNFKTALRILNGSHSINTLVFVRDNLEDLRKALKFLKDTSQVVICSGGLGLTPDDITLKAFSTAFDIPLVKSDEKRKVVEENIKNISAEQYRDYIDELSEGLKGSIPIRNPKGVAAGEKITIDNTTFYILPGVPNEFEAMLNLIVTDFKMEDSENSYLFEVEEKEARLIKLLREIEKQFKVKTSSYPPIEANEKLKIILHGKRDELEKAKRFFEETLKNSQITFKEIGPSHTS